MSTIKVNSISDAAGANGNAITLATDGTCTAKITNNLSNRNLIINGAHQVSQRNGSSSVDLDASDSDAWVSDRWHFYNYGSGELDCDVQRIDNDAPAGFKYAAKLTVTTPESSGGTPAVNDRLSLQYRLEGTDLDRLDLGESTAKAFYISFWVKSSLTGNFGLVVTGATTALQYPVLYPISTANTWEKKTIKIPGPTSGSWVSNTGAAMHIKFGLYTGSNKTAADQGITGTGTWLGASTAQGTDGQVQLGGTNGATWLITGFQMEVDQTTDFEHRSYGDELARCQRYYQQYVCREQEWVYVEANGANNKWWQAPFTAMRTTPTVDKGDMSTGITAAGSGGQTVSSLTVTSTSAGGDINGSTSLRVVYGSTWGTAYNMSHSDGWAGDKITFSAEL